MYTILFFYSDMYRTDPSHKYRYVRLEQQIIYYILTNYNYITKLTLYVINYNYTTKLTLRFPSRDLITFFIDNSHYLEMIQLDNQEKS